MHRHPCTDVPSLCTQPTQQSSPHYSVNNLLNPTPSTNSHLYTKSSPATYLPKDREKEPASLTLPHPAPDPRISSLQQSSRARKLIPVIIRLVCVYGIVTGEVAYLGRWRRVNAGKCLGCCIGLVEIICLSIYFAACLSTSNPLVLDLS